MVRIAADEVTVEVPATSANLGPGFDSLGLALDLCDRISVRATVGATRVFIEGQGAGQLPTNDNHLVVQALRRGLDHIGASQVGLDMQCFNQIPQARGMGSSAAAIIGGLMLARGLTGGTFSPLTKQVILELATEMEGHPDNVSPALFGGIVASAMSRIPDSASGMDQIRVAAVPVNPIYEHEFNVFIPGFSLATSAARSLLPLEVSHKDAVANSTNVALLVLALQKEPALLYQATEDYLHQDYRRSVMKSSVDLMHWLRKKQLPAVISGAGPTVLVFGPLEGAIRAQARENGWDVRKLGLNNTGAQIIEDK